MPETVWGINFTRIILVFLIEETVKRKVAENWKRTETIVYILTLYLLRLENIGSLCYSPYEWLLVLTHRFTTTISRFQPSCLHSTLGPICQVINTKLFFLSWRTLMHKNKQNKNCDCCYMKNSVLRITNPSLKCPTNQVYPWRVRRSFVTGGEVASWIATFVFITTITWPEASSSGLYLFVRERLRTRFMCEGGMY